MTENQHIVITRGLPGSGKTTASKEWVASEPFRAHVSRDDLREAVFYERAGFLSRAEEDVITAMQDAQVRALIKAGFSVVVDDLNLRLRYARRWADLAQELGVKFEVWDFDTDVEVCVNRNHERRRLGRRFVEPEAVRDLAQRFPASRWPEVLPTPPEQRRDRRWTPYEAPTGEGLWESIYLVDIDGTVAKKKTGEGSRDWHDYGRAGEDLPNWGVIRFVEDLRYAGHKIIFMSGRKEYSREVTRRWLSDYVGEWTVASPLFMRADGDNRSDDIVKHELFHDHINGRYFVRGAIDDRDRVVAMWRAIGLTVAQIDYGNF